MFLLSRRRKPRLPRRLPRRTWTVAVRECSAAFSFRAN